MGKVWWSDQAVADLEIIDPAVRDQLVQNVGEILHVVSPRNADPAEDGVEGEIMWHRGDGHRRFTRLPKGPQDYFLIYKRHDTASLTKDPEFEVLAVYSIEQVACMWVQMTSLSAETVDRSQAAVIISIRRAAC